MRRRKSIVLFVLVPLLVVLAGLAYLELGDLGWIGSSLTSWASDAMKRPLVIQGSFAADLLSASPHVVATDVTLADPDGDLSPGMVQVERLEGHISFSSLYSLPVKIEDLHIQGGLVRLGPAADGSPNWHFGGGEAHTDEADEGDFLPVTFGSALLESVTLRYEPPSGARPIVLEIDRLELEPQGDGEHRLRVEGHLRGRPFKVSGTTTRLEKLIFLRRPVDLDLRAGLAEMTASVLGSVGRIWALAEPELRLDLEGPEIAQLTEIWELPSLGTGPFSASARTSTGTPDVEVTIDAALGDLQAKAEGFLDDLLRPHRIDLSVDASGHDLAASGALLGQTDLPRGPFEATGRVRLDQGRFSFHDVEAHLAESRLAMDGVLGPPPGFSGTDFELEASGPSLAPFEALAGVSLPEGPFDVGGRLVWQEDALELDELALRLGDTTATVSGSLGTPPDLSATDLELEISGTSLGDLDIPLPAKLPDLPFEATARMTGEDERFRLDTGTLRLGEDTVEVEGTFHPARPRGEVRLDMRASGPDLGGTARLFGVEGLLERSWEIAGGLETGAAGLTLRPSTLRSGEDRATIEGLIGFSSHTMGTDLTIAASGSDASRYSRALGETALPATSWELGGRLRRTSVGLELEGVEAVLGEVSGQASGLIGLGEEAGPSRLDLAIQGDDLSAIESWRELPTLPEKPFSLTGILEIGRDRLHLEGVEATLAANRLRVEGELPKDASLSGADLRFGGGGPDLPDLMQDLVEAGFVDEDLSEATGETSDRSWELEGRLLVHPETYELSSLKLGIGDGSLEAGGTVGRSPGLLGTDISLNARGANAALLGALVGVAVPPDPYTITARVAREEGATTFDSLKLKLGDSHVSLDGRLGDPPRFAESSLVVDAHLEKLRLLTDVVVARLPDAAGRVPEHLRDLPVGLAGQATGSLDSFAIEDLKASLGRSDLSGRLSLDRRETLAIEGQLASGLLDIPQLRGLQSRDRTSPEPADPDSAEGPTPELLIPDIPLSLEWLPDATGELHLEVDEIVGGSTRLRDLTVGAKVDSGVLTLDPVTARGYLGGSVEGRLEIRKSAENLELSIAVVAQNIKLVQLMVGDDPAQAVTADLELELESSGSSLRSLAMASSGRMRSRFGPGLVNFQVLHNALPFFLREVTEVLNPFSREDPVAHLQCGYFYKAFADGGVRFEPLVLQSDRMTILGDGSLRFSDEALDLQWTLKPRKAPGLTSAAATANPYIKLGGTLAHPQVELKPLEATVSAGAAVATGGLSFIARKLWHRVTAGRKVCKKAQKAVARVWQENP